MCNFIENMTNIGQLSVYWTVSSLDTSSPLCMEECRPQLNLDIRLKKRQPWRYRLFVFYRLLSTLTPPMDSWASCPSIKLSPWLRLLSKESSRVASSWRTAYRVGVKRVGLKQCFSVSCYEATCHHLTGLSTILTNGISCGRVLSELWL